MKKIFFYLLVCMFFLIVASAPAYAYTGYVSNFGSNTISVFDTSSNSITTTISGGTNPNTILVNSAGSYAYVVNAQSIGIISLSSNTIVGTIPVPGSANLNYAVISADGTRLYVDDSSTSYVNVIDLIQKTVIAKINVDHFLFGICINPIYP